jgi:hypothetical protein
MNLLVSLTFLLFAASPLTSHSQNRKYLVITGKIIPQTDRLNGASVQIIKNENPALNSVIAENGRFRLELEYNADYKLTFCADGLQEKTIVVNTEIPIDINKRTENLPHFLMAVKLFEDCQDIGNMYSGEQAQQITYSIEKDCFSRVPTMFDIEYVEKGNFSSFSNGKLQENKARTQIYQVF